MAVEDAYIRRNPADNVLKELKKELALEYQTLSELMLFQNSFKLGARLMVEVMHK